ncbi:MAG: tetratricopeptide repeat protein [Planctomycetota bacterium]
MRTRSGRVGDGNTRRVDVRGSGTRGGGTRGGGARRGGTRGSGTRRGGTRGGGTRGGGARRRGGRGGYNWGWGHHHHDHHHHYWLGLGLWCGFGYYGGYCSDYWYHHYRYHPYRFLHWWCPDYYYYRVPIFVYPPDSVVSYDETELEPRDEEHRSAKPLEREVPTIESIIANHVKLGDFYFREGKYDKAAESYLRALAYAPEDASIHFILADALFGMGDYHYAAFIIRKALRLDPEMAKAKADKREFYKDPKEFEKQLETLRKYIGEKPYDSAAHLVLGYNLYFSGKPGLAKEAFAQVLKISPDDQAAQLFLGAMEKPAKEEGEADKKPEARPSEKPTLKPADKPAKKD